MAQRTSLQLINLSSSSVYILLSAPTLYSLMISCLRAGHITSSNCRGSTISTVSRHSCKNWVTIRLLGQEDTTRRQSLSTPFLTNWHRYLGKVALRSIIAEKVFLSMVELELVGCCLIILQRGSNSDSMEGCRGASWTVQKIASASRVQQLTEQCQKRPKSWLRMTGSWYLLVIRMRQSGKAKRVQLSRESMFSTASFDPWLSSLQMISVRGGSGCSSSIKYILLKMYEAMPCSSVFRQGSSRQGTNLPIIWASLSLTRPSQF